MPDMPELETNDIIKGSKNKEQDTSSIKESKNYAEFNALKQEENMQQQKLAEEEENTKRGFFARIFIGIYRAITRQNKKPNKLDIEEIIQDEINEYMENKVNNKEQEQTSKQEKDEINDFDVFATKKNKEEELKKEFKEIQQQGIFPNIPEPIKEQQQEFQPEVELPKVELPKVNFPIIEDVVEQKQEIEPEGNVFPKIEPIIQEETQQNQSVFPNIPEPIIQEETQQNQSIFPNIPEPIKEQQQEFQPEVKLPKVELPQVNFPIIEDVIEQKQEIKPEGNVFPKIEPVIQEETQQNQSVFPNIPEPIVQEEFVNYDNPTVQFAKNLIQKQENAIYASEDSYHSYERGEKTYFINKKELSEIADVFNNIDSLNQTDKKYVVNSCIQYLEHGGMEIGDIVSTMFDVYVNTTDNKIQDCVYNLTKGFFSNIKKEYDIESLSLMNKKKILAVMDRGGPLADSFEEILSNSSAKDIEENDIDINTFKRTQKYQNNQKFKELIDNLANGVEEIVIAEQTQKPVEDTINKVESVETPEIHTQKVEIPQNLQIQENFNYVDFVNKLLEETFDSKDKTLGVQEVRKLSTIIANANELDPDGKEHLLDNTLSCIKRGTILSNNLDNTLFQAYALTKDQDVQNCIGNTIMKSIESFDDNIKLVYLAGKKDIASAIDNGGLLADEVVKVAKSSKNEEFTKLDLQMIKRLEKTKLFEENKEFADAIKTFKEQKLDTQQEVQDIENDKMETKDAKLDAKNTITDNRKMQISAAVMIEREGKKIPKEKQKTMAIYSTEDELKELESQRNAEQKLKEDKVELLETKQRIVKNFSIKDNAIERLNDLIYELSKRHEGKRNSMTQDDISLIASSIIHAKTLSSEDNGRFCNNLCIDCLINGDAHFDYTKIQLVQAYITTDDQSVQQAITNTIIRGIEGKSQIEKLKALSTINAKNLSDIMDSGGPLAETIENMIRTTDFMDAKKNHLNLSNFKGTKKYNRDKNFANAVKKAMGKYVANQRYETQDIPNDERQTHKNNTINMNWVNDFDNVMKYNTSRFPREVRTQQELLKNTQQVNNFISYLQEENDKSNVENKPIEEIRKNINVIAGILSNQEILDTSIDREALKDVCANYVANAHINDKPQLGIPVGNLVRIYEAVDDDNLKKDLVEKIFRTEDFSKLDKKTQIENQSYNVRANILTYSNVYKSIANSDGILLDTFKKEMMKLDLDDLVEEDVVLENLLKTKACREDKKFNDFITEVIDFSQNPDKLTNRKNYIQSEWTKDLVKSINNHDDDNVHKILNDKEGVKEFIKFLKYDNSQNHSNDDLSKFETKMKVIDVLLANKEELDIDREELEKVCIDSIKGIEYAHQTSQEILLDIYKNTDNKELQEVITTKIFHPKAYKASQEDQEVFEKQNFIYILNSNDKLSQLLDNDGPLIDEFKVMYSQVDENEIIENGYNLSTIRKSRVCQSDNEMLDYVIRLQKTREAKEDLEDKMDSKLETQWVKDFDTKDPEKISELLNNTNEVNEFVDYLEHIRRNSRNRDDYSTETLPQMRVVTTILANMDKLNSQVDKDEVEEACIEYIESINYFHQIPKDLFLDLYCNTKNSEVKDLVAQKIFDSPMLQTELTDGDQTIDDETNQRVVILFKDPEKLEQIANTKGPLAEIIKSEIIEVDKTFLLKHKEELDIIENSKLCENDEEFKQYIQSTKKELTQMEKRWENKMNSKWVKGLQTNNIDKKAKLIRQDDEVRDFIDYMKYTEYKDFSTKNRDAEILPTLQVMEALIESDSSFKSEAETVCADYLKSVKYSDQLPKDLLVNMYAISSNEKLKEVITQKLFNPEIREDIPNKEEAKQESIKESYIAIAKNMRTITNFTYGPLETEFKNYFVNKDNDQKIFMENFPSLSKLRYSRLCLHDAKFSSVVCDKLEQLRLERIKEEEKKMGIKNSSKTQETKKTGFFRNFANKFIKKNSKKEVLSQDETTEQKSSKNMDGPIEVPDDISTGASVNKGKDMKAISVAKTGEEIQQGGNNGISSSQKQRGNGVGM